MKSSTENNLDYIRQVFILVTSIIVGITVLTICIWLYYSIRGEVETNVSKRIDDSKRLVLRLVEIKKKELGNLAEVIEGTPILRGALATNHEGTINDVLNDLRQSNSLSFMAVIKNGKIQYSSEENQLKGELIKSFTHGHLLGVKSTSQGQKLILGKKLSKEILGEWNQTLGGEILSINDKGEEKIGTISFDQEIKLESENLFQVEIHKIVYYAKKIGIFNNTNFLVILKPKEQFWTSFYKKRNTLLFIGVALFFFGVFLSVLASKVLLPLLSRELSDNPDDIVDIAKIIEEIEAVKKSIST